MAIDAYKRHILSMVLLSCLVMLCACKERLMRSSVQTAPRVHFERAHQLEFATDHVAGAKINNIGFSHSAELRDSARASFGLGPSIYNRPERVPDKGVENNFKIGAFVGAVIVGSRYKVSLSFSGHEEECTLAAAFVVSFGAQKVRQRY